MITPALIKSCLTIFFCRIIDVSMGTFRMVLTVKEKSALAGIIGFIEIFIWYVVVKDAISSEGPVIAIAIAYAGGFACGTYIGTRLSKLLISGSVSVQVVTTDRNPDMLSAVRDEGYALTVVDANESEYAGEKYMIFASIDKKKLKDFEALIKRWDENAFILVQDAKSYRGGYFGK